jgi:putative PIN family toxin of toxin-antitoxin system
VIRAVLDTNQYVSMAIKAGGIADRLLTAWREGRFVLLVSPPILGEIFRVLRYPRLRRFVRLTPADLDDLVESLLLDAELTPGRLVVRVVTRDPSDNMFLACAVEGHADYIVSGDQDLLTLSSYQGISIVRAAEFLRILAKTR